MSGAMLRLPVGWLVPALFLIGCDGESLVEFVVQEGNITVVNTTESPMEVTYSGEGEQRVQVVEGGQAADLFRTALPGGTEVSFRVGTPDGPEPQAEITTVVDGDVMVEIVSFGAWGAGELEYTIHHAPKVRRGSDVNRVLKDGRVFLLNEHQLAMDVRYADDELGEITLQVPAGQKQEISQRVLKGGTRLSVRVESVTMYKAWEIIVVTVDGSVTIRISSLGGGKFSYRIE